VRAALRHDFDAIGNKVLYDLCTKHPRHRVPEAIGAKLLLIGRTYAAAIERRKNADPKRALRDFYRQDVVPVIRRSNIDQWFEATWRARQDDVELMLRVHKKLVDLFTRISGHANRSLASKYLHFHFRKRFYIIDSRALRGLQRLRISLSRPIPKRCDKQYALFVLKVLQLKPKLDQLAGHVLLPREVDRVLLAVDRAFQKRRKRKLPAH
jgi:hypothetical protein